MLEVGGPPVPSIQAYEKCFAENAKKSGLTIVGEAHNTKDTAATAQPIVADLLTKTPDVDAIWAYNDASALGASAALTSNGEKVYDGSNDGVIVFGQNGDVDAITAIREHRLTGTVDPDNVATGWALIKALSGSRRRCDGRPPAQGARRQESHVDVREHRRLQVAARPPLLARHRAARRRRVGGMTAA